MEVNTTQQHLQTAEIYALTNDLQEIIYINSLNKAGESNLSRRENNSEKYTQGLLCLWINHRVRVSATRDTHITAFVTWFSPDSEVNKYLDSPNSIMPPPREVVRYGRDETQYSVQWPGRDVGAIRRLMTSGLACTPMSSLPWLQIDIWDFLHVCRMRLDVPRPGVWGLGQVASFPQLHKEAIKALIQSGLETADRKNTFVYHVPEAKYETMFTEELDFQKIGDIRLSLCTTVPLLIRCPEAYREGSPSFRWANRPRDLKFEIRLDGSVGTARR